MTLGPDSPAQSFKGFASAGAFIGPKDTFGPARRDRQTVQGPRFASFKGVQRLAPTLEGTLGQGSTTNSPVPFRGTARYSVGIGDSFRTRTRPQQL